LDFLIPKNFPFYPRRGFILIENTSFLTKQRGRKKKEGDDEEE
jgi:hypothetical protein